jgi:peptidoglycan hydrolase-like protein with peptidoglycan-binding domain
MVRVLRGRRYERAWKQLLAGDPEYWRTLGACQYYTASRHVYYHEAARRARQIARHLGIEDVYTSLRVLATWAERQRGLTDCGFACGFACGAVDGLRGPQTQAAIYAFQRSEGISVDGWWGPQTRRAVRARLQSDNEVVLSIRA